MHQLQHVVDALFDVFFADVGDMHGKRHILVDRHGGDEAEILEDDAHLAAKERHFAPAQPGDVLAVHHDAALGGQLFAEDELEQSGLAGAGVAHQKDELAVVYMEVDVLQSGSITPFVYLGDMFKIYHEYLAPEKFIWHRSSRPNLSVTADAVTQPGLVERMRD